MKKLLQFISSIILIITFSSCIFQTPKYLYAPNSANLLQVENKGDLKASINYSRTKHAAENNNGGQQQSNGIEFQSAYGLTKNIGVKAEIFSRRENDESTFSPADINYYNIAYKRSGADISLGYYKKVGSNKNIILNIYAGIGTGKTEFNGRFRDSLTTKNFYEANHFRYSITPSVSFKASENYSIGIAYKFSSVNFSNINTNDRTLTTGLYAAFAQKNSRFGDLILHNEFGFNKLKGIRFQLQFGTTQLNNYLNYVDENGLQQRGRYEYNNRFSSFGIIGDINKLFSKKTPSK